MPDPLPLARPLGLSPSFGFGDRLGLATLGHARALLRHGGPIRGIFAQQSVRELTRTGREAEDVMQAAQTALRAPEFAGIGPWGADADHLKEPADIERYAKAGFTFYTLDPSPCMEAAADAWPQEQVEARYAEIRAEVAWVEALAGQRIAVPEGPVIDCTLPQLKRAAVKIGRAIGKTVALARSLAESSARHGLQTEIEVSVDETDTPTSFLEHWLVAHRLREEGVTIASLAPRFPGSLEKGVEYKGDPAVLAASMNGHGALARFMGPYKLSLHSGSDKLAIYPLLARASRGCFHVKSAGTSYLEALRVLARHDADGFRQAIALARARYAADRASYHVSAELAMFPEPAGCDSAALEAAYLDRWEDTPPGRGFTGLGRQVLHCAFGSILTDPALGPRLRQVLAEHAATHEAFLVEHFARHLRALQP